ncbi:MAG: B12-binding domain-containing radical SAM protein [Promethearchaeota archaeon]
MLHFLFQIMIDICLFNPLTEFLSKEKQDKRTDAVYKEGILQYVSDDLREPPSGLMVLAAILEKKGYSVEIIDASILYNSFDYLREHAGDYRLIGFTGLTNTFSIVIEAIKLVKRYNPDIYIVLGGPHASFRYREIFQQVPFIDAIFVGEAEESFPWFIDNILKMPIEDMLYTEQYHDLSGDDNDNISKRPRSEKNFRVKTQAILNNLGPEHIPKGIVYLKENADINSMVFTGFPDPINLNSIPLPARHLIPMVFNVADVLVNRGCPNKCSFCSRTRLFPKVRLRPLELIKKELKQIKSYPNYKFVNFYDNINLNRRYFSEFLDLLIDLDFLPWGAELRVDAITPDIAQKMKESKCKVVATGIETANKEVLKKNFKIQDPEKIAENIKLLKDYDINIQAYFVIGLPGDTIESFNNTLEYIKKLPLKPEQDRLEFFVLTPYPGSDIAENPDKYHIKIIDKNYNHYDSRTITTESDTYNKEDLRAMIKKAKELKQKLKL